MKTLRIIVNGRVQGVYFRVFCQKQAVKLGISGFVRNTNAGDVEIIARASQTKLDKLIRWCWKGPIMAKVSHVEVTDLNTRENFNGFEIR